MVRVCGGRRGEEVRGEVVRGSDEEREVAARDASPPHTYTMGCLVPEPAAGATPGPGVAPPAGVPISAIFVRLYS